MKAVTLSAKVSSDGVLRVQVPVGIEEADKEVQVTVELLPRHPANAPKRPLTAVDLLQSDLVGMWADRDDFGDDHAFARNLREQAQTRNR